MCKLLTPKETANKLATTPGNLAQWRCLGTHNLPYLKLGTDQRARIRYRESDIDKWIEDHMVGGNG